MDTEYEYFVIILKNIAGFNMVPSAPRGNKKKKDNRENQIKIT